MAEKMTMKEFLAKFIPLYEKLHEKEDVKEILEGLENSTYIKHYISAIEAGISRDKILEWRKNNLSTDELMQQRMIVMKEMFGIQELDPLKNEIEKRSKECEEIIAKNEAIITEFKERTQLAMDKVNEANIKLFKSKDDLIKELRKRISENETKIKELETKAGEVKPKNAEANVTKKSFWQRLFVEPEEVNPEEKQKRKAALDSFRDTVLNNEEFSDDQKDYFLTALEKGTDPSKLKEIAGKNINVKQMERLLGIMKKENEND